MQCREGDRDYVSAMISDYPAPLFPLDSGAAPAALRDHPKARPPRPEHTWVYHPTKGGRTRFIIALTISAAIHAVVFFGPRPRQELKRPAAVDNTPVIQLQIPNLKDLDEPERAPVGDDAPVETTAFAPMQPDLPQVVQSSDFVQQIDISSLIERPDLSGAKVYVIPENINRGTLKQNLGTIFNIADLDRPPEPMVQTPPLYPYQLKREGLTATVRVQFIVDSNGAVVNAFVVDSNHPGFNEAALTGVGKWKFRAGIKGGRRVNTRMEVPIIFRLIEE